MIDWLIVGILIGFLLGFLVGGGVFAKKQEAEVQEEPEQEETIIVRKEDAPTEKRSTVQMYLGDYFHLCRVFSFLSRAQMRYLFLGIIEDGGEYVARHYYPQTMTPQQAERVGEELVANGLMAPRTSKTAALKWDRKGTPTGEKLIRMMVDRLPETDNSRKQRVGEGDRVPRLVD